MEKGIFVKRTIIKRPNISFRASNSSITIYGNSICEDACNTYDSFKQDILSFCEIAKSTVQINFMLKNYNMASIKCIVRLLKEIEKYNKRIVVNWYYNDDYTQETGLDIKSYLNMPFNVLLLPYDFNLS